MSVKDTSASSLEWGRPGIYNKEYFTGSQCAMYIGDILVDEVVRLEFEARQSKKPIYGYASTLYDDMSRGQFILTGNFSVNFKEAGYLWLVLNEYKKRNAGIDKMGEKGLNPFRTVTGQSESTVNNNIERIINKEMSVGEQRQALTGLLGYAATTRARGGVGGAENIFETFENYVWGGKSRTKDGRDVSANRRPDDNDLQGFDIYVVFGDYVGNDNINHTVQLIKDVHILNSHKVLDITGDPVLESYQFVARELI